MRRFLLIATALLICQTAAAQESVIYLCARKGNVRQVPTPTCVGKEKLQTIALTPGPQGTAGPQGPEGPPGSPGPPGPAGPRSPEFHLIDGSGTELGIATLVGLNAVLVYVSAASGWLYVDTTFGTAPPVGSIFYPGPDCAGAPFASWDGFTGSNTIIPSDGGTRFWAQPCALDLFNPPPQIVRMSRRTLVQQTCENLQPSPETSCPVVEVTSLVPLHFPLTPPLSVVPQP